MTANILASLVTKLTVSNPLARDDIRAIQELRIVVRRHGARETIAADGAQATSCCLVAEGFALRSKTLAEGTRQVLSLHIPGEIPDLQSLHLRVMDHDLLTVTPCTIGYIAHPDLRTLTRQRPNIADALWRETLVDSAIFREWIVNLGRREAAPRMAHLLLELYQAEGHRSGEG